ncbi:MAG: class E sortase [Candidatus Andersenbacteria bacterium]
MAGQNYSNLRLFVSTFVSAFLFLFGAGTLLLMFFPVFADVLIPGKDYQPQLPVAPEQTEPFIDVDTIAPVQPFPPLSAPENVAPGSWIRIPSLALNVPLALSPTLEDTDILKTLDQGAALYPNGILPGQLGNTFISAHSTGEPWKGKYRFAFLKINDIEPGNVIHLDYQGARYTYTVVAKEIIHPAPDYRVVSDRPIPTVTLMACWPLWTTNQRMLITGELTNITKLTVQPI